MYGKFFLLQYSDGDVSTSEPNVEKYLDNSIPEILNVCEDPANTYTL